MSNISKKLDILENMIEIPSYFRSIRPHTITEPVEEFDTFYTSYQIFCLKSRLEPVIYKLFGPYQDINFATKRKIEIDRMQLCVRILENEKIVQLTDEQFDIISRAVKIITTQYPNHCLFYDASQDLKLSNGIILPAAWQSSLLPYLFDEYIKELKLESYEPIIDEDAIYIKWPHVSNQRPSVKLTIEEFNSYEKDAIPSYEDRHYDNLLKFINIMKKLYMDGTIVCSRNFCSEWNLEIFIENTNEQTKEEKNSLVLGKLLWIDTRLGIPMTQFLRDRLFSPVSPITLYPFIPFRESLLEKHFISYFLSFIKDRKSNIIIGTDKIFLYVDNFKDLSESIYSIWEGISFAAREKGHIYIQKLQNIANIDNLKNMILDYIEQNEMEANIVVYKNEYHSIYLSIWTAEYKKEIWETFFATLPLKITF